VLCGPGNNGGDGYVIARALRQRGVAVRVAALGDPATAAATAARAAWGGDVIALDEAQPADLLVDALFGTGLTRPLEQAAVAALQRLAGASRVRVAVDLPSGAASDDGSLLSPVPPFDLTVTFQTLKPSHLLQPAARFMGRVALADIGVAAEGLLTEVARPRLGAPGPDDHKYRRGYVAVVGGEMPGAAALTASAALRAGAGYVRLVSETALPSLPHAVVQSSELGVILDDMRIGALAVGPGLGRGGKAEALIAASLRSSLPKVLDADALWWLGDRRVEGAILTPHEGEFRRLFPDLTGSKVEQARAAAARAGAVIVYKGPDTVIAAPDGRAAIAAPAPHWLASAGTGDVLTGIVAAMRASGLAPFEAACAGVWLHGRAAALAGPALIADDLVSHLPAAIGECL
jgi:hydroxyethylthiazole kinase-like uncharacterized protein yjeF